MTDRYMKTVLTVIAACLVVIAFRNTPVAQNATALWADRASLGLWAIAITAVFLALPAWLILRIIDFMLGSTRPPRGRVGSLWAPHNSQKKSDYSALAARFGGRKRVG